MSIATLHAENRIIRGKWADRDGAGRELLCLYTALAGSPDARPETCPASLCPAWLAHLIPWLDDSGSLAAWPGVVRRVVALAPRLAQVPPAVEWQVRALCVREAMRHTSDTAVLAVCERVAVLCERRGRGEVVPDEDFEAAAEAAEAAEAAAARAAWAAWAVRAVRAAAWAAAAAWEAVRAAGEAAVDRLSDAILTAIEASVAEVRP